MGVIEHSDVIENAVTLGGGGGGAALDTANTWTAPQTIAAGGGDTLLTLAPAAASGSGGGPGALALAPTLPEGATAAAGLGAVIQINLPSDLGYLYQAVMLHGVWTDAADATAASELRIYLTAGGSSQYLSLVVTPNGVQLPPVNPPASPPGAGAILYCDQADGKVKIKDSDGVVHALW